MVKVGHWQFTGSMVQVDCVNVLSTEQNTMCYLIQ